MTTRGDGSVDLHARIPEATASRLKTYLEAFTAPRQQPDAGRPGAARAPDGAGVLRPPRAPRPRHRCPSTAAPPPASWSPSPSATSSTASAPPPSPTAPASPPTRHAASPAPPPCSPPSSTATPRSSTSAATPTPLHPRPTPSPRHPAPRMPRPGLHGPGAPGVKPTSDPSSRAGEAGSSGAAMADRRTFRRRVLQAMSGRSRHAANAGEVPACSVVARVRVMARRDHAWEARLNPEGYGRRIPSLEGAAMGSYLSRLVAVPGAGVAAGRSARQRPRPRCNNAFGSRGAAQRLRRLRQRGPGPHVVHPDARRRRRHRGTQAGLLQPGGRGSRRPGTGLGGGHGLGGLRRYAEHGG